MFPETPKTNPMTELPLNWFEDESRDYANLWDGEALRASATSAARGETPAPLPMPQMTMMRE